MPLLWKKKKKKKKKRKKEEEEGEEDKKEEEEEEKKKSKKEEEEEKKEKEEKKEDEKKKFSQLTWLSQTNCGWWRNTTYTFEFSVKSSIRIRYFSSCAKKKVKFCWPVLVLCVEIVLKCNMTFVGTSTIVYKWLIQFN